MKDYSEILEKLERLHQTGPNRWTALCPAHDDRSPSLSIEDKGERLLLHCFVGCSFHEVCAALDIMPSALFADGKKPDKKLYKSTRLPPLRDMLSIIHLDVIMLVFFMDYVMAGQQLNPQDWNDAQRSRDRLFNILRHSEEILLR